MPADYGGGSDDEGEARDSWGGSPDDEGEGGLVSVPRKVGNTSIAYASTSKQVRRAMAPHFPSGPLWSRRGANS